MEYITTDKDLLIPIKPVYVKFFEKEEVLLNAFQNFILEAVEEKANMEQMTEAILLTKTVLETEMMHMEEQKLLVRREGRIELTEISKSILLVARCVKSLNLENRKVGINLITGEIEEYNPDNNSVIKKCDMILSPKIMTKDLDGISIEDNTSFFATYMKTFELFEPEDVEKVLASVYLEFKGDRDEEGKNTVKYKRIPMNKIPCLIGTKNSTITVEDKALVVEGRYAEISFAFSSYKMNQYKDCLLEVDKISERCPDLLSETGMQIARERKICRDLKERGLRVIYDYFSGEFRVNPGFTINTNSKKAQLKLSESHLLDERKKTEIIAAVSDYLQLGEEYIVSVSNVKDDIYKLDIPAERVWENL